ncbi:MAG: hypothetical protein D6725_13480 [Planctomycetota bacterium]|nr:MAG: hypothetical protein D6725_13480 [Planctomycetota bacterium]
MTTPDTTTGFVDFLPDSYRRRQAQRQRRKLRRWAVAVALSLMFAGGLERQRTIHSLQAQQRLLRQQYEMTSRRLPDAAQLRRTLKRLEAQANLLNYLRLRVPPTRLLACVTNTLPKYVSLAELHVEYEAAPRAAAARNDRSDRTAAPVAAKSSRPGMSAAAHAAHSKETVVLPSESDIRRLLEDAERYRTVVVATGMAVDDLAVSQYLANLKRTGLFDDVRLVFTTEQIVFDQPRRAFEMRLTLKRAARLVTPSDTHRTPGQTAGISEPAAAGTRAVFREARPVGRRAIPRES